MVQTMKTDLKDAMTIFIFILLTTYIIFNGSKLVLLTWQTLSN